MYADGHVSVIFARKWCTITVTPTLDHCSCNMAVCVHCIRPIKTCLGAFIVDNGTHWRNGRAVAYDSALLTRRQIFGRFPPCAEKSPIFVHFGLVTDIIVFEYFSRTWNTMDFTPCPDDAWRFFDCPKHKRWRWRSQRLCEINKISARWPDDAVFQPTERRKATHRFPLMSGPTYSYGNRYMQHPGGLGKHVMFHVDVMAI